MPNSARVLPILLLASSALADQLIVAELKKVAPEDGVPEVGAVTPTWCDEIGSKNASAMALVRATDGKYIWDAFPQAAKFSCAEPDNPVFQQQVGYYLQRWANYTGASKEQLVEFITLRVDDEKWDAQLKETCEKKVPAPEDEDSPRAKHLRKMERAVLGCDSRSTPQHIQGKASWDAEDTWSFDRAVEIPSQLAGLYRIQSCYPGDTDDISMFELAQWAECRKDLEQLDETKLLAELKAQGHNDYARIIALQALSSAQLYARLVNAKFQAVTGKDPEVKAVLVDAPAKGWDGWVAAYTANKAAVDAARAYEDLVTGPRISAAKGCLPKVGALLGLVNTKPVATPEALAEAANSGVGPILLNHFVSCLNVEGKRMPADAVRQLVEWGMPARGPRTAAQVAMADATAKVIADRPKFPVTAEMVRVDGWTPEGGAVGHGHRQLPLAQYAGVVKAVKKEGDRITVSFQTVKWKEKERECTPTNRILQWRPDGTPLYMENCRYTGRIVEQSSTAEPFYTLAIMGAAIKPGVFVAFNSGAERIGQVFEGTPVAVWSSKEKTKLLAYLGVEAK